MRVDRTSGASGARGRNAEAIDVDDVRDDLGVDAEAGEDVLEEARRDGVPLDPAQRRARDRRAPQMIGRLAAAVVHDDRLAEQLGDQDRRQRREQEREVRRGEDVDDVRPAQLADEQRPVAELGGDRPQVLDRPRRAGTAPAGSG